MGEPATIYLKDWLTLAALLAGPVIAVWWTLFHQDRKERRAAKERLFITLMAHRRSNPISKEWAQALNVIDVVYADDASIVAKWHSLYMVLNTAPLNYNNFLHGHLELLSEMARVLGYKNIQQTDIDKFYVPDVHTKQAEKQAETQTELLRVLKSSHSFSRSTDGKP